MTKVWLIITHLDVFLTTNMRVVGVLAGASDLTEVATEGDFGFGERLLSVALEKGFFLLVALTFEMLAIGLKKSRYKLIKENR